MSTLRVFCRVCGSQLAATTVDLHGVAIVVQPCAACTAAARYKSGRKAYSEGYHDGYEEGYAQGVCETVVQSDTFKARARGGKA